MGTGFCQQSGLRELHCELSNLILNFLSYQSQFHGFHNSHGLRFFFWFFFSQHFKHNVWLVVQLDVTGDCLGREGPSWSSPGVCRSGAAQAGQRQGWAAVTFLTERSRPNSLGTTGVLGVFGVTSVRNDVSSPSCTAQRHHLLFSFLSSFTLCLEILWDLFPILFFLQYCVA